MDRNKSSRETREEEEEGTNGETEREELYYKGHWDENRFQIFIRLGVFLICWANRDGEGKEEGKGEMRRRGEKAEERRQIPDEKISPPRTKPKQ